MVFPAFSFASEFLLFFLFMCKGDIILEREKNSVFNHGLIWFGAAVSISEIFAGTSFAPLGFAKGLAAIVLGHLIGFVLFYYVGLIGAQTGRSSMETVKMSFGQKGSLLFSVLNIMQLVGWTAIMIVFGAEASGAIAFADFKWIWSIAIGFLIIIWILVGIKNLNKINILAMGGLFSLTILLSVIVFRGGVGNVIGGNMTFGAAVELSVAMPLSWLPLVSDYTREAKNKAATFTSAAVYFFTSLWMYVIGMGAALLTGEFDIAKIMMTAGLGILGLIIIIFSTVTTTFLDAYSAGVSAASISKKCNEKWIAVAVCILGTLLALFTPVTKFTDFLYLIGTVFAPMIAILLTDVFILKKDHTGKSFNIGNLLIWAIGFAIYRLFLKIDTPVGSTLPVMIIISILCIISNKVIGGKKYV